MRRGETDRRPATGGNGGGIIRWEDPPPPRDHLALPRRPWELIACQLRNQPGRWALVDDSGNMGVAARITAGAFRWWAPAGTFQAVRRYVEGRPVVYARYVGPPAAGGTAAGRRARGTAR